MAYLDELDSGRKRKRSPGNHYEDVRVGNNARAHLGDTYHIGINNPLRDLPYAKDAPFNAYEKQHELTCLKNTRVNLLQEIHNWADGQDERCIFWLSGLAGTGKSTIARTVARSYYNKQRLAASFFFSRGGGEVGHAGKFVTSLAVQIADNVPASQQHMHDAVEGCSSIASQSLRDQWQHLVLHPLSKLHELEAGQRTYIIVIDALDECDNDSNIRIIVQLLAEARSLTKVRLRVLLTSRPEMPIRHGFRQVPEAEHQDVVLHNIAPSIVDNDIGLFLQHYLRIIAAERSLGVDWPGTETIKQLVRNACGLFIWAATAWRFIRDGKRFASRRLRTVLEGDSSIAAAPEKHLNEIYVTVLQHSIHPDYTEEEREEQCTMLRTTLGSIVVLFSPLPIGALSRLLHISKQDVDQTLEDLHAILDIPEDPTRSVRLHHPSFRDFLLDKERCGDSNFWTDEKQAHQLLAKSCIQLMATSLKQDICGVDDPGMLVADMERSQVERSLPSELQYACLYWVQHVQKSSTQPRDNDQVHQFLQEHLLHWLEALGWMGRVPEGVHAIASLDSFVSSSTSPSLSMFIHDAERFILYSRVGIEQAPLQTYSGLVFAPTRSLVRERFQDSIPRWTLKLPKVEEKWSAVLQTLEGHTGRATAVAFSPDGKTLASASWDQTVKVWDAGSGTVLQTLEGHTGLVNAVAFSPDGKTLASASWDTTVKVWDASSGTVLQTLEGHTDLVNAVAFSRDGKMLASASCDETVRICDVESDTILRTLEGHTGWVNAVAFSPDGKTLASASWDKTVKVWDASSGAVLQTLESHIYSVRAVAFSQDGKMLASTSDDKTVKVWDARSGAMLQTLEGHTIGVNAVAFSPDGKTLASASWDKTVKVWDASSGAILRTLESHTGWVTAVAFSPDSKTLASASADETVKIWDTKSDTMLQTLEGHTDPVTVVTFSPDGKTLASASEDKTVKLWDTKSGVVLQILEGHTDFVAAVAFSQDGKMLASVSGDKTVKVWDAGSGAMLQTLEDHTGEAGEAGETCAVAFSQNGKILVSVSYKSTVKVWDAGSRAVLQTLDGHTRSVAAMAFSRDGKILASASWDKTVKVWNTGSGAVLQTFHYETSVSTLSFSEDATLLQTRRGSLSISTEVLANITPAESLQPSASISIQDQWVCRRTRRILWLPPEYRPYCVAVYKGVVGFGYESGRVMLMEVVL